jgi:hypothetical protein
MNQDGWSSHEIDFELDLPMITFYKLVKDWTGTEAKLENTIEKIKKKHAIADIEDKPI